MWHSVYVLAYIRGWENKDTHGKEEECKERGIVSATNAVVDPRTMMITSFDAVITQLAVT
jgi:hypothetical protein